MKHKKYWWKLCKWAKDLQTPCTERKTTLEGVSVKIRDTPFFRTIPLFYQPLPLYGKNLNLPFSGKFWKLKSPIYKGGVPTTTAVYILSETPTGILKAIQTTITINWKEKNLKVKTLQKFEDHLMGGNGTYSEKLS